jgi:LmbE family N-acetylglucosaminyl deacetylase
MSTMSSHTTTLQQIRQLGTILSIWAHPDDETFMAGGLLSMAATAGQQVLCVTATDGSLGVQDATKWPAETLGEVRQNELAAALDILGIKEHESLGYTDGTCSEIAESSVINRLVSIIDKYKPDTVVTFAPDGVTGHPDHQAVSRWSLLASDCSDCKPTVYFATQTQDAYDSFWKLADEQLHIYFATKSPIFVDKEACDIHLYLEPEFIQRKTGALKAMPSQYEKMFDVLGERGVEAAVSEEAFVLASRWVYP